MAKTLIITHTHCLDGLCAAWAAAYWLGRDNIEIVTAQYDDPPPDVTGRHVLIFDFSYNRDTLIAMHTLAKSMQIFDHHKGAADKLAGLPYALFDNSKSGAVLAWEFLADQHLTIHDDDADTAIPLLLLYAQDQDLWTWALPQSRDVHAYLANIINYSEPMDTLLNLLTAINKDFDVERLAFQGGMRRAPKLQLTREISRNYFRLDFFLEENGVSKLYKIPTCFAPSSVRNEVGEALALMPSNHHGVGLSITNPSHGKFGFSFRGHAGSGDLALRLATFLGGSGHDTAAGAGVAPARMHLIMYSASIPVERDTPMCL